jgi:succinate-semialdehyde dehydrogenase/glutarate-semialdehyde dehydrogenase
MKIQTLNPATEQILQDYECLNEEETHKKLLNAHQAYLQWKITGFDKRTALMLQLGECLKSQINELSTLMAQEMGKPITAGYAEINKCVWLCEHYANHAEKYLSSQFIETEMKKAKVCYLPLGIVFAIMPWNFPFWQVFRFAVPSIMAGNVAVLKHAPNSSGTGIKIEELFLDAGFPKFIFQQVIVDNEGAAKIIEHPYVTSVTLTGSDRAGRAVASHAGKFLKKSVLELGGSDPYLVLEDADLELAANCIVNSRLNNSGQVCIAAKRIIVLKSVAKELTQIIIKKMSSFKMGNPLSLETQLGPLARADLRKNLHIQVEKSLKQGAKLLLGGIIIRQHC